MRNEKRLIDANALIDEWNTLIKEMHKDSDGAYPVDFAIVISAVSKTPTVDAVEVVHGRWEVNDDYYNWELKCSLCGEQYWIEKDELETHKPNYCPKCGAKMDAEVAP